MVEFVDVDWLKEGGKTNDPWSQWMLDLFQMSRVDFKGKYGQDSRCGFGVARLPTDQTDTDYICRALVSVFNSEPRDRLFLKCLYTYDIEKKTRSERLYQDPRTLCVFALNGGWPLIKVYKSCNEQFPLEVLFTCLEYLTLIDNDTATCERTELLPQLVTACGHNVDHWKRLICALPIRFQYFGISFNIEDRSENSYSAILSWLMTCAPPVVMHEILSDSDFILSMMCAHPHHHELFLYLPDNVKQQVWNPVLCQYKELYKKFVYKNVLSNLTYAAVVVECGDVTSNQRVWLWHVDQALFAYALSQDVYALQYMAYNGIAKCYPDSDELDGGVDNIFEHEKGLFCDPNGEPFTDHSEKHLIWAALCVFRRVATLVAPTNLDVLMRYCTPLQELIVENIHDIPKVHVLRCNDFACYELSNRARDNLQWMVQIGLIGLKPCRKKQKVSLSVGQTLEHLFWKITQNPPPKAEMLSELDRLITQDEEHVDYILVVPWQRRMILDCLLQDYRGDINETIVKAMHDFKCTRPCMLGNRNVMKMQIQSTLKPKEWVDTFNRSTLRHDMSFILYALDIIPIALWDKLDIATIFPLTLLFGKGSVCKACTLENFKKYDNGSIIMWWWCVVVKK